MVSPRSTLLVEDNPDDEILTLPVVRRGSVTNLIQLAPDREEALTVFAAKPLPCIVMLGLKLPQINGLEILPCIRSNEHTRIVSVVALTSSNEERDIVGSHSLDANSHVLKPLDFDQFTRTVSQLGLYGSSLVNLCQKGDNHA